MKPMKKALCFILAAAFMLTLLPSGRALAVPGLALDLGEPVISGDRYHYEAAEVAGDGIRTILICFSDSVTPGDEIFLPATPAGFTVSATSADNDYVKRISLVPGTESADVQAYIRGVGFAIASRTQSVEITITAEQIEYDTYYNIDKEHYYQYIPDLMKTWLEAYDSAQSMVYMGRTGYLATVLNQEEDIFVNALSGGKVGWLGGTIMANTGTTGGSLYYDGFNANAVVPTGWYWACGPEKGTIFYNVNSLRTSTAQISVSHANSVDALNTAYYYNWRRGVNSCEPNNLTATYPPSQIDYFETCLTTLQLAGSGGKHGTAFSWNDLNNVGVGEYEYYAKGYFVEYGNDWIGDSGEGSLLFATAGDALGGLYPAIINTYANGSYTSAPGAVELRQGGSLRATAAAVSSGTYVAYAADGAYDVYINGEDTEEDVLIDGAADNAGVHYFTVSFASAAAGIAMGSSVSATANGSAVASGALVLAGKTLVITAAGSGAPSYRYLWSGEGTDEERTAQLSVASLGSPIDALCTVTGVNSGAGGLPAVVTNTAAYTALGITLNGSVASGAAVVTERGFIYGTSNILVMGGTGVSKVSAGSGTGAFSASITGLSGGVYYARAYAISGGETVYGATIRITADAAITPPQTGAEDSVWIWALLCCAIAGIAALGAENNGAKARKRKK